MKNSVLFLFTSTVLFHTVILVVVFSDYDVFGRHGVAPRVSYNNYTIPLYDYGNYGTQINPLFVAGEVIHHAKGTQPDLQIVLNNADWLVENRVLFGNYSLLIYDFPAPAYRVDPPWASAMAQSGAAFAMARAYNITNDTKYLDAAKEFLNALYVDVKDGGVTHKSAGDGWWYEEYAFINGTDLEPRVLNGMMVTLQSLHRYYENTHDLKAMFLFNKGIEALTNDIRKYDIDVSNLQGHYENTSDSKGKLLLDKGIVGLENNTHKYQINASNLQGYSFYDALGKLPGESYHKYHVSLLSSLLEMVNDKTLKGYRDKWESYSGPFIKGKLSSTVKQPVMNMTS